MPAVAAGVRVAAQGQPLLLKCKPVSSATSRVSVHKIRILSGMWNRPRSIRTRVSSTKNGILRSPERRQRAELTQSAAPTEAYRRPRPCRGPAKLRKSLALSDGSDKCATETELVGWGGSNHKEGQNVFFCRALVEYELSIYRQKYRHFERLSSDDSELARTSKFRRARIALGEAASTFCTQPAS